MAGAPNGSEALPDRLHTLKADVLKLSHSGQPSYSTSIVQGKNSLPYYSLKSGRAAILLFLEAPCGGVFDIQSRGFMSRVKNSIM